ncbi:MAG: Gfo/Idh/MocA family oxidoreductase [Kiritimatiellae bacterium]|nr:Gfo/Idh/MocA family oxidoreductase [Kiritimatiellia bacterium]
MKQTRRSFLKGAAAIGAFNLVPAKVLWGADAPSNQLTRALIGFGSIAHSENHLPFKGSRLVGLCDPDQLRVAEGLETAEKNGWGKVKAYKDFLELLADPGVDIVHICTPPHWHGVQSLMAARAGKDIWCEKPMTRTVGEGKRVMDYVKAKGRMFRLNTWFRFQGGFYGFGTTVKPIRQVVEGGVLGKGPLRCVFGAGQGFSWKFYWSGKVNLDPEPCPKTFDWDMWLGPAPWKPYNKHRTHGTFRGYWDYDSGGLGDMAQHYLDPLQYLLCKDETSPVKVDYVGPKQHPDVVGRFDRITLTYADGTEVILDGDESLKEEPLLRGANGVTVWPVGKLDGKVINGGWTNEDVAKTQFFGMLDANGVKIDVPSLLKSLPEPAAQQTDFIDSVRTRRKFCLNEETGFRSCTMFNLAIAAERLGRGFEFDPVKLVAKDDEAANRFLYQEMREPWAGEFARD